VVDYPVVQSVSIPHRIVSDLFQVLHKFTVDLPKKHGRGGQSALRFARLRMEKRHNYVRKVAEVATQLFIIQDKPNVCGLILAGSADFKTELSQSDMFDPVNNISQNYFSRSIRCF
jgi:peptide subunit release factor 1 (eRF1)